MTCAPNAPICLTSYQLLTLSLGISLTGLLAGGITSPIGWAVGLAGLGLWYYHDSSGWCSDCVAPPVQQA